MPENELEILRRELERLKGQVETLTTQKEEIKEELSYIGIDTELKATLRIKSNNRKIRKFEQEVSDLLDQAEDKLAAMGTD